MEDSKEMKNDTIITEEPPSKCEDLNKSEECDSIIIDESPSRSKDLSKSLPEEAFNNFVQGKRHMLVHDYTFAVQSLAVACELYVKHFGELAKECGEVYFLYGKSLVRLSQQQSGVLGDALNKAATTATNDEVEGDSSEEEGKEENENESESGEDKEKEKNGSTNGSEPAEEEVEEEEEEKEPSESTDSPQAVENNEVKEAEKENEADADSTLQNETVNEGEADAEKEDTEEEDDLELAWNSLEAAKTIFSRQEDDREAQLKIAEIFQLLAEISMESDNYPEAINDLKSCLCIQRQYLAPDDRLIAHTYYEMGLGHMLQKMYDEALEDFTRTLEIFQLRRNNLVNAPIAETVGGFEAADRQRDLEEINSVITDIKEKIDDTRDLIINAKNELQEAILKKENEIQADLGNSEKLESTDKPKPVSNITHLLKRKKPDEEEKGSDSKRLKLSNGNNGDASGSK